MFKKALLLSILTAGLFAAYAAESIARIAKIEGRVELLRVGADAWRPVKPNMPLAVGDQLYSREESFVEIVYATGAIVRMDENTKITLAAADGKSSKTNNSLGGVWVNMQKLVSHGKEFEISSPTATASIRGTVFEMNTAADSTTDVSVFDGTVAVGPSGKTDQGSSAQKVFDKPVEVQGPQEVPGPYEVSLNEWIAIVANQRISVRKDGKFSQEKFDPKKQAEHDDFVKKNLEMDKTVDKGN